MKNVIYFTILVMIGFIGVSCDKNDGAYYPVPSDFSVSPAAAQSVGTDGGTIELTISAGNLGWWIESSQTWCKISRKYGSGDDKVTVTVDKNASGAARQATVTVSPTFKKEPVKITVNQQ